MKWTIGIDPGFGGTGVVLRKAGKYEPLRCAIWRNDDVGDWPVRRAMSICIPMMEEILGWITHYGIDNVRVCLETPIYNNNSQILMLQMSLLTLLQTYIYDYIGPHVETLELLLVNNKSSKLALTGSGAANKQDMISHSPWKDYKKQGLTFWQAHTLADAYAHSLCEKGTLYNLHELIQYIQPQELLDENT